MNKNYHFSCKTNLFFLFFSSTYKIENISKNSIALLTQQKMDRLGINKKQNSNQKRKNASRVCSTPKVSPIKQKFAEFQQVFTMENIYELDLCLFPTAERSRDGLASNLINGNLNPSEDTQKSNVPSKNAKRKKKKIKTTTPNDANQQQQQQQNSNSTISKDEVKKTLDKIADEEAAEQAILLQNKKNKALQEKKKAELRVKQEKERKEKEKKKQQEEKLRLQKEEEKRKQEEIKKRKLEEKKKQQEEREKQKRIEKEAEELFRIHGKALLEEIIEEVVCDLCNKLAQRSIHEANKQREKQRIEDEERQQEFLRQQEIKQRKKEQREARRQLRNQEAEILWNSLVDEVIESDCRDISIEFIRDLQIQRQQQQQQYHEILQQQQHQQQFYPPPHHPPPYISNNPPFFPPPSSSDTLFSSNSQQKQAPFSRLFNPNQASNSFSNNNLSSHYSNFNPDPLPLPVNNNNNPSTSGDKNDSSNSSIFYQKNSLLDNNNIHHQNNNNNHHHNNLISNTNNQKENQNHDETEDMPYQEELQSELRELIGDDDDSPSLVSSFHPSSFSSNTFFSSISNDNHPFGMSFGSLPPVEPPTSVKPEDSGFDPTLTVLLSNLPMDMRFIEDTCSLFGLKFPFYHYKDFLVIIFFL